MVFEVLPLDVTIRTPFEILGGELQRDGNWCIRQVHGK